MHTMTVYTPEHLGIQGARLGSSLGIQGQIKASAIVFQPRHGRRNSRRAARLPVRFAIHPH